MTLLVLAAGMGSRFGGLKQMEGFGPNGETILEYSLYDARLAGFTEFVFVIRRDLESEFRERILSRLPSDLKVRLCYQELSDLPEGYTVPEGRTKPWGTGHAVWVAREVVRHPFALVNADDFYGRSGFQAIAMCFRESLHSPTRPHAVVAYDLKQTLSGHGSVSRGVCEVDSEGCLVQVKEHTAIRETHGRIVSEAENPPVELPANTPVSLNLLAFQPSVFAVLDREWHAFLERSGSELKSEFYVPTVVNRLAQSPDSEVVVLRATDAWLGVTHKADTERVKAGIREHVERGIYPSPLWG